MNKQDKVMERAIKITDYMIETGETVRNTAKKFHISKSTVHMDITERIQNINPIKAKKVKEVLQKNKEERHIRGGMATKKKYQELNKK